MSQSSPMSSATAAGAAVILAPLIAWFVAKWNLDMPAAAQASMAALLVGGAHWLGNFLTQWIASRRAPMPAPAAPPAQAGRTLWFFPLLLALIAIAACMSGCTTTTASLYKGYTSEAVAGVKMWDDNTLATVRTVLCAQPYSAIQRHPELQPGVQALCGPLANVSSLDANQLSMLMQLLNASGVKLQAAPAPK